MNHESPQGPQPAPPALRPVRALRFLLLLAFVAVAVAASGVTTRRKEEDKLTKWTAEQAVPDVAIVRPKPDEQSQGLVLPGDVEANFSASIHGQAAGYVREWRTDIGAKVKRGETLAIVDTPELDQRVTEAEGEFAKSKAKQALAHVTAQRWKTLRSSAAVSQQAIDEKESDASATDADVAAAQANLDRLRALKAFSNIAAPFDGVVTARNVDVGSLVTTSASQGEPLFVVADVSRMRIYVRAPQIYAAQLHNGMQAGLILPEYPGRIFPAQISTTSDAIDAKSRALLVELTADNRDGLLKPGAFAQVTFQLAPTPNSMSVPASALLFRNEAILLATVDKDSRIQMKKIEIARDYGARVEIASGLSAADDIVRNPPESLTQGDAVNVVETDGVKEGDDVKGRAKLAESAAR
jgi:RND family efflux transporter MFP subunit